MEDASVNAGCECKMLGVSINVGCECKCLV